VVSVNRGEYCVSKAGLSMAAKLWAARLAGDGVQVFELRPGIMATDMTAAVKDKYERLIAEGLVPQGRWGTAEDVGRAVRALMRGDLPFSTGEVINVDGGIHLRRL
jgi:NAD(P)-dependent dehydrogenase (short-subunit alcohol dehydrogenase family)